MSDGQIGGPPPLSQVCRGPPGINEHRAGGRLRSPQQPKPSRKSAPPEIQQSHSQHTRGILAQVNHQPPGLRPSSSQFHSRSSAPSSAPVVMPTPAAYGRPRLPAPEPVSDTQTQWTASWVKVRTPVQLFEEPVRTHVSTIKRPDPNEELRRAQQQTQRQIRGRNRPRSQNRNLSNEVVEQPKSSRKNRRKNNRKPTVAEKIVSRQQILAIQQPPVRVAETSPVPEDPQPGGAEAAGTSGTHFLKPRAESPIRREDLDSFDFTRDGKINIFNRYEVDVFTQSREKFKESTARCITIYKFQPGSKLVLKESLRELLFSADCPHEKLKDAIFRTIKALRNWKHDSRRESDREQISQDSLPYLETQYVYPLKKKSQRFPAAAYFCRLCDYHINGVRHSRQHIISEDHIKAREERHLADLLSLVPPPSSVHLDVLNRLVRDTIAKHGRSCHALLACAELEDVLSNLFQETIHPECSVRVYGSCATGLALTRSNVNLELVFPESIGRAKALTLAYEQLAKNENLFVDVRNDFSVRWPFVSFKAKSLQEHGDPECVLSVGNWQAFEIGRLLRVYVERFEMVASLGQALRHWAKVCKLDSFETGGLAPYVFDILLVHYLQQKDMLPVLHELQMPMTAEQQQSDIPYQTDTDIIMQFKPKTDWHLGELWLGFFKFYAVERDNLSLVVQIRKRKPMLRDEKGWNKKRIAVEDPYLPNKNVGNLTVKNYEYFSHCMQWSYRYFGIPQLRSVGPLFKFENRKLVINTRGMSSSTPTNSPRKQCPKVNSSSTICSGKLESASITSADTSDASTALTYDRGEMFEIRESVESVSRSLSRLSSPVRRKCRKLQIRRGFKRLACNFELYEDRDEVKTPLPVPYRCDVCLGKQSPPRESSPESETTKPDADCSESLEEERLLTVLRPDTQALEEAADCLDANDYCFSFSMKNFCHGKEPEMTCNYCGHAGHKADSCPEKVLPVLESLPDPTPQQDSWLNRVFQFVHGNNHMQDKNYRFREQARLHIEQILKQNGFPECNLDLFGSSTNGFGFANSDLDLCLRLNDGFKAPADQIPKKVINRVAKVLFGQRKYFSQIVAVTGAKVPIVKFVYVYHYDRSNRVQFDADISFYNVLALRNTQLLRFYSSLDPRVQVLGVLVKVFAKSCCIGDASKGSLSSYAYILMMLHYLQRCHPAVIPVLQEIGDLKPHMIDRWDTYFCNDPDVIRASFNAKQAPNTSSVPFLWMGFLRYYTEKFDFGTNIIQMRTSDAVSKFDKGWTDKPMCIEDPFDRSHNLASGLSKRMYSYIRRSFIHGRTIFCSPRTLTSYSLQHRQQAVDIVQLTNFLFCPLDEEPPSDRQCRLCGRVGHFVENCPRRRPNKTFLDESSSDEKEETNREE